MFIAALFTIAKTLQQPKWPLTDDWIKKMRYMYTMNIIQPWMDLEIIIISEVSQRKTNKM